MKNIANTTTFSHNVKQIKASYSKEQSVALGQQISTASHEKNDVKDSGLTLESIKKQNNKAILQASMEVSVGAGNEPLALLYKVAIDNINEVLKPEFGENAIQTAYDTELDVSPKATADRIVSMSTAFFSQYQDQHGDLTTEEAVKSFAEIIAGGIDKGFAEAKDVLEGLKVLEGEISRNINATYDLVQDGLQDFVDRYIDSDKQEDTKG